jgi:acyl-CoA synthetase (AMP-forming)/AMP-acid ligase II
MRQVLELGPGRFGDQPFLVFPDRTYTYRSILEPVASVAAVLQDRFRIGPGDRVAIAAANVPGHAITAWAAICLGATVVELNGWWTGPEMEHGIGLTRPAVVFGDRRRLDRVPSLTGDVPVVCFEDDFGRMESGRSRSLPADPSGEDDPLCILFTSGTTGRPKGAMLSHRAHIHMMMQAALQGQVGALVEQASSSVGPAGGGEGVAPADFNATLAVSPLFHISGFSVSVIGGALIGLTAVYPPAGRWDPETHLALTERHRITAWSLVPTQLWRLLEHPRFGDYDLSSLQRVGGGGATFQPELWKQVREKLPQVRLMATGYGMTETCGAGTHQDRDAALKHPDAVGAPVPGYSICIRDAEGRELGEGETGEIFLRGASNLLGYWDDPGATAEALDCDRWYRTKELGHFEDGLLFLDGRGPDLIIRGGENVFPTEIENRLVEHPDITEAAVVGVPDRVMGEEVKAYLVVNPGSAIDLESVRSWVGETLAAFKVPSQVEIRADLPHNAAGKVIKHLLRNPSTPSVFEEE